MNEAELKVIDELLHAADFLSSLPGRSEEKAMNKMLRLDLVPDLLAEVRRLGAEVERLELQNKNMRTLLLDVTYVWGDHWDCSRTPGHPGMHSIVDTIQAFLAGLKCREQVPPTGEPCGNELPCAHHPVEVKP